MPNPLPEVMPDNSQSRLAVLMSAEVANKFGVGPKLSGLHRWRDVAENLVREGCLQLQDGDLWMTDKGRAAMQELPAKVAAEMWRRP